MELKELECQLRTGKPRLRNAIMSLKKIFN